MNSKYNLRYKKPTRLKWYFIAGALALSSSLSMAQEQGPTWLSDLQDNETKRVIIILDDLNSRGTRKQDSPFQAGSKIEQSQNAFFDSLAKDLEEKGIKDDALLKSSIKAFQTVNAVALEGKKATLQAILRNPFVAGIQEDRVSEPELSDSVPLIEADQVWENGYSGQGQVVAILDSGVDKTHPDLRGKIVSEACYSTTSLTYDASTLCPNKRDEQVGTGAGVACGGDISGCSHGTHVAGIAAANGGVKGVAKDANIIAIQVFSRFYDPAFCGGSDKTPCALSFESDQIAALERIWKLHESGMDIAAANMSLGGGKNYDVCNGPIKYVIDRLRSVGIATIAASGNSGYTNGIASPACIESAIAVGATNYNDTVANYSNSAGIIDLLAPGTYIRSTIFDGKIGMKSGTSMATPHVTGAFAVLKSVVPNASVDEILAVLKETGVLVTDHRNGITKPRINLKEAFDRLAPNTPPTPALVPNISVSPNSHDFGDMTVGNSSGSKTLRVSNIGNSDLEIGQVSLSGDNFSLYRDYCSNTTVAAGTNCIVKVTFVPQTAGVKNATLSIPSNDPDTATATVTLTGNGLVPLIPNISVTPTSYHFGDVTIGDSSNPKTLRVSNSGNDNLEIGQISLNNKNNFSLYKDYCSNTTVVAGASCIVRVTFVPQTVGAKNATLSIPSNDPDTAIATATFTGNGLVPLIPDISVSPASLKFGDVMVGNSSSQKLTVSNIGNGNLNIGQISLNGSSDFSINSDNCSNTTTAANTNCTVIATCTPQTPGVKNATLSIPSNDPDTATATVALTCSGFVPLIPDISVSPASLKFGDVMVGSSSSQQLTVSNIGNGSLNIGQINLNGSPDFSINNDTCSNTTTAANANCTVIATCTPQTPGVKNATLSIPSNDPDTATATVALTCSGFVPLIPDISVNTTSLDFGDMTVGESSVKILTVSNKGNGNLKIGQINLGGGDFSINKDQCSNTTVVAGAQCTVKITFAPQNEGAKNALLSILSNDPDTATVMVTLMGNGFVPLIPSISVTPSYYEYDGEVTIGESSGMIVGISNTGNGDLEVGQVSLDGDEDFSIGIDGCSNTTVAAGTNCIVEIIFTPRSDGEKNTTLSIPSNDPNLPIMLMTLMGNGVAPLVPEISVTPASHDFGDVNVDESLTVEVIVSNTGTGNLEIEQINLDDEDFSINIDNCSNTTVIAGDSCTVEIIFAPETEGAKNATLSIPSNAPDTFTMGLQGEGIDDTDDREIPTTSISAPASCQLYAVNDKGLNNSQFFTINLALNVNPLGSMCHGCDIEALAIHPQTNIIYAASGDDATNGKKGHLYTVDGDTGVLTSVGSTGFDEIEGLAFNADGNILWAWAKGDGMITIDFTGNPLPPLGTLVMSAPDLVEDIALSDIGTIFYGAIGTELWMYDVLADDWNICTNLPGETEALERLSNGFVLIGTHKDETLSLHVFDPITCEVQTEMDILVDPFDDVEGIALPTEACLP